MRRTLFERLRRFRLAVAVLAMHGLALQTALAGASIGFSLVPSLDGAGPICRGDAGKADIGRAQPGAEHGCQCPASCPHHAASVAAPCWNIGWLPARYGSDASLRLSHAALGVDIVSRDGPARAPPIGFTPG
jgi:hypothetical protein